MDQNNRLATSDGTDMQALAIVEAGLADTPGATFGVGLDSNIVTASVRAVLSVANRLVAPPRTAPAVAAPAVG